MTDYLTTAEAAAFLGLSISSLKAKRKSGFFELGTHYFRPPGMHPRWSRAALEAWIRGQRQDGPLIRLTRRTAWMGQ